MNNLIDKVVSFQGFYYIIKECVQLEADMCELSCFIIGSDRSNLEPTHIMMGAPKKLKCNLDVKTVEISDLDKDSLFGYNLFKE